MNATNTAGSESETTQQREGRKEDKNKTIGKLRADFLLGTAGI